MESLGTFTFGTVKQELRDGDYALIIRQDGDEVAGWLKLGNRETTNVSNLGLAFIGIAQALSTDEKFIAEMIDIGTRYLISLGNNDPGDENAALQVGDVS